MSSFETKFAARAARDPAAFTRGVQQRYGHTPANVVKLLGIASKLSAPAGALIGAADLKAIQSAHPNVDPGFLHELARDINAAPARQRAMYFQAAITGDFNVMRDSLGDASAEYKEVDGLVTQYTTQTYADEVNARRGGSVVERPAWKPEPGSVRENLERAFTPPAIREITQAVNDGHPMAEQYAKNLLANSMESAAGKLADDSLNLHDHLSASYDMHTGSDMAEREFGINGEDQ